jgi:hypothetical protein
MRKVSYRKLVLRRDPLIPSNMGQGQRLEIEVNKGQSESPQFRSLEAIIRCRLRCQFILNFQQEIYLCGFLNRVDLQSTTQRVA